MDDPGSLSISHVTAVIIIGLIIIVALVTILSSPAEIQDDSFSDDNCRVNESGLLNNLCVPLFRVVNHSYDMISVGNRKWNNSGVAPSPEECPAFVEKALEPYGGLPPDANLTGIAATARGGSYDFETNIETSEVLERCVNYDQVLYGTPLIGHGGYLTVCLTNDGQPDLIDKQWKTVEEVGLEEIIPASEALLRLQNYEGSFRPPTRAVVYDYIPDGAFNLTISDMEFRYFASNDSVNGAYLEPVWKISAVDEIRKKRFIFYVPAGSRPAKYRYHDPDVSGIRKNFSQLHGSLPVADISFPRDIMIGTNGPVGETIARESVREFVENPEINLSYEGRFRLSPSSSGCLNGYQGEYYSYSSGECHFHVDVYTGAVVSALINESCIRPGFSGKSVAGNISSDEADKLSEKFSRAKYQNFDRYHLTKNRAPYLFKSKGHGNYYLTSYSGDFSAIWYSGVEVDIRVADGLVTSYSVTDNYLDYSCAPPAAPERIDV